MPREQKSYIHEFQEKNEKLRQNYRDIRQIEVFSPTVSLVSR